MNEVEIEQRLTKVEQASGDNCRRIKDLEKRQDNLDALVASVAAMQKDIDYTKGDIGEIKADIKALMEEPKKKWDTVIAAIISAIVAAGITFLATLIR